MESPKNERLIPTFPFKSISRSSFPNSYTLHNLIPIPASFLQNKRVNYPNFKFWFSNPVSKTRQSFQFQILIL